MDVQACLNDILAMAENGQVAEAMAACDDLQDWLDRGGFAPVMDGVHYVAIGDGGNVAYTLLSAPGGSAIFTRYTFNRRLGRMIESACRQLNGK